MVKSPHFPDDLMELPRSAAEARAVGSLYYFTNKPCSHGHLAARRTHNGTCQACQNKATALYHARIREEQRPAREAAKEHMRLEREARDADPEYQAAQKEQARNKAQARKRKRIREESTEGYYRSEAKKQAARYWRNPQAERDRVQARRAKGEAGWRALRLRTPPWLTPAEREAIERFYKECPAGFHVDHIAPIKHTEIAGLHVLSNLQYLPARRNRQKRNVIEHDPAWYVEHLMAVWAKDVSETGEVDWTPYYPK